MRKIRISSGKSRGLNLVSEKNENLRPTKDRIKEALFNILQFKIKEKNFLDLFGGTGQIGIEAFSRGAKSVTIVDNSKESIRLIKSNVSKLKISHENINIFETDALNFLSRTESVFDIVFLDPPYTETALLENCLNALPKVISKNAIIITETLSEQNTQNICKYFSLQKKYKYGKISLNLYQNGEF